MRVFGALLGVALSSVGCSRAAPSSSPTSLDASSSSTVTFRTPTSDAQLLTMEVTPLDDPLLDPFHAKFSLHVRGRGFYVGAMPWSMKIGDQGGMNGMGSETDLEWHLQKEPAIGDELFISYGESDLKNGGTGIHYAGLGKISVAHE